MFDIIMARFVNSLARDLIAQPRETKALVIASVSGIVPMRSRAASRMLTTTAGRISI
jgi:hypothetical protein